jgi:Fe-S cluster biosynthesis and repair protein YggX
MFINEYRLSTINPKDRKFLQEEMEKFFFGEGASAIDNFKPV